MKIKRVMEKHSNQISRTLAILFTLLFCLHLEAKTDKDMEMFNPISTQVPSLTIAPDARGGGMGDVGAATTPDVNSQYWNPAKYAFAYSKGGFSVSYTPWLRKLVNDINLVYAAGYFKPGSSDLQAIGASLRYFSMGEIQQTDDGGAYLNTVSPYEMAFDLSYSRKLGERFSGAVAIRYIRSDMGSGDDARTPGNAFAADIAGYYTDYVVIGSSECQVGFGFNISNIGTKISFDGGNTSGFIPTNLRLGGSLYFPFDDYNMMSINLDLNKYLVPTPPVKGVDESDADYQEKLEKYNNTSSIASIFKSFGDAPGGFKEELQEIMVSVGAEYSYNDQFFVRGGYYHESQNKGNRKYFTVGAGFKMSIFQLDAAYLISTVQSNPLDQTLRFSLSFDMDGIKDLFKR
ncbi:MAG: type IX secretion system outer membrane channel protein PorV [Bacteroidales bacterium]|nr:type IX secretion system outer membrane channel protein PorV [Bacteroidales bacterium]